MCPMSKFYTLQVSLINIRTEIFNESMWVQEIENTIQVYKT